MEQFNPKPVAEDIETKVGNLSGLNTTEKTSLVGAVNEVKGQTSTLSEQIAKIHTESYTLTTQVKTADGNIYRSGEKSKNINSSNVVFASITPVNVSYPVWATITKIQDNKVYYTVKSTEAISTDTNFTVYVLTVNA